MPMQFRTGGAGPAGTGVPARSCEADLHEGAGVGTEAGQRGRCATGFGCVLITRVVVETGVERRHRRRGIVVKDHVRASRGACEKSTMTSARSAGPGRGSWAERLERRCLDGCRVVIRRGGLLPGSAGSRPRCRSGSIADPLVSGSGMGPCAATPSGAATCGSTFCAGGNLPGLWRCGQSGAACSVGSVESFIQSAG